MAADLGIVVDAVFFRGTEAQLVLLISFKCMGKGNNKNHQQCIPADAVIHAAELHDMNQNIQQSWNFERQKNFLISGIAIRTAELNVPAMIPYISLSLNPCDINLKHVIKK